MCITESLNARSASLAFQRDLKAAPTAAVNAIEAGRSPPQPRYTSPVAISAYTSPPHFRRRGDTSARANNSPSPSALRYVVNGGLTPKRKHDTFDSLRDPSPHGDREHPDKVLRLDYGRLNDDQWEGVQRFVASMTAMEEFTRRVHSPGSRSSQRGSMSP